MELSTLASKPIERGGESNRRKWKNFVVFWSVMFLLTILLAYVCDKYEHFKHVLLSLTATLNYRAWICGAMMGLFVISVLLKMLWPSASDSVHFNNIPSPISRQELSGCTLTPVHSSSEHSGHSASKVHDFLVVVRLVVMEMIYGMISRDTSGMCVRLITGIKNIPEKCCYVA